MKVVWVAILSIWMHAHACNVIGLLFVLFFGWVNCKIESKVWMECWTSHRSCFDILSLSNWIKRRLITILTLIVIVNSLMKTIDFVVYFVDLVNIFLHKAKFAKSCNPSFIDKSNISGKIFENCFIFAFRDINICIHPAD